VQARGLSSDCVPLASDGAESVHNIPSGAISGQFGHLKLRNFFKLRHLLSVQDSPFKVHASIDKRPIIWHAEASSTYSWRTMMALAAHIAELAEKHRLLERKIEAEVARPGSDDIEIHRLKLEKLKLKDEIVRLSGEETRH